MGDCKAGESRVLRDKVILLRGLFGLYSLKCNHDNFNCYTGVFSETVLVVTCNSTWLSLLVIQIFRMRL